MNRSAGYTLIEVLIMLAVTAILAATVLETVRASTANGIRIEQAARNASQDYITLASVRRAVQASRPDYIDGAHKFVGDETGFSSLTSLSATTAGPGALGYRVSLVNAPEGANLVYEDEGGSLQAVSWPGGIGRLSYFGEAPDDQIGFRSRLGEPHTREWSEQWPPRQLGSTTSRVQGIYYQPLPRAIRVEVDLTEGRNQVIVFQLPITAPPQPRIEDLVGSLQ